MDPISAHPEVTDSRYPEGYTASVPIHPSNLRSRNWSLSEEPGKSGLRSRCVGRDNPRGLVALEMQVAELQVQCSTPCMSINLNHMSIMTTYRHICHIWTWICICMYIYITFPLATSRLPLATLSPPRCKFAALRHAVLATSAKFTERKSQAWILSSSSISPILDRCASASAIT